MNDLKPIRTYTDRDVEVLIFVEQISDKHLDPFWYEHYGKAIIAEFRYQGRVVSLEAVGDIRIVDTHEEGRIIRKSQDLTAEEFAQGDGLFWLGGPTDSERFEWVNNNWFEAFYIMEGDKMWSQTTSDPMYDYKEAIGNCLDMILDDAWWAEEWPGEES